jgi:hypothetical protein
MKRWLTASVVWLATFGMILPPSAFAAPGPDKTQPLPASISPPPLPLVSDVALGEGGVLSGQVVNRQGVPVPGASVVLRQNDVEVGGAATDLHGQFRVSGLRGGLYQVGAGQGAGIYRLWAARTAPPSAQTAALVVSGNDVIRGQCCGDCGGCNPCCCDGGGLIGFLTSPIVVAALVATAIAVPIALANEHKSSS